MGMTVSCFLSSVYLKGLHCFAVCALPNFVKGTSGKRSVLLAMETDTCLSSSISRGFEGHEVVSRSSAVHMPIHSDTMYYVALFGNLYVCRPWHSYDMVWDDIQLSHIVRCGGGLTFQII